MAPSGKFERYDPAYSASFQQSAIRQVANPMAPLFICFEHPLLLEQRGGGVGGRGVGGSYKPRGGGYRQATLLWSENGDSGRNFHDEVRQSTKSRNFFLFFKICIFRGGANANEFS